MPALETHASQEPAEIWMTSPLRTAAGLPTTPLPVHRAEEAEHPSASFAQCKPPLRHVQISSGFTIHAHLTNPALPQSHPCLDRDIQTTRLSSCLKRLQVSEKWAPLSLPRGHSHAMNWVSAHSGPICLITAQRLTRRLPTSLWQPLRSLRTDGYTGTSNIDQIASTRLAYRLGLSMTFEGLQ